MKRKCGQDARKSKIAQDKEILGDLKKGAMLFSLYSRFLIQSRLGSYRSVSVTLLAYTAFTTRFWAS